jgi:hypothetical protein
MDTIRETPFGSCIGATIIDITADDAEEFLADPKNNNHVYFHLSNGHTIFATLGDEGEGLTGLLDMEADDEAQ